MPRKGYDGGYSGPSLDVRTTTTTRSRKPVSEKIKSVSYSATQSDKIFEVSSTASATSSSVIPSKVEIENNGNTPIFVLTGYEHYSDDATDEGVEYLHTMLMPGQIYSPPIRGIIALGANTLIVDGTVVDNEAITNDGLESGTKILYSDSGADTTEGFADDNDTTITFDDGSGAVAHNMFKVNDLIRLDDEVCRITSIVDTAGDGAYTPAHFIVDRAVHGTAKADHTNNTNIRFPFFNAYHDFDKYTVAQTDNNGKFKCHNMFGKGRTATGNQGITPGSFSIKFYTEGGYQNLGMSGISSSTHSGLTTATAYKLDITVDGGTLFQDLTFTTGSNLNFGGNGGIIELLQAAFDTQYYTAGNLFEKKVTVGIVDGDIRFTSGSHLSTSAILLADTGDSLSLIDATANGRIPASGDIPAPVAARLPDDYLYDNVTYTTSLNPVFGYDNGNGRINGNMCSGTINYETGAIDIKSAPENAEFVFSCMHSTAFSGKLNEGTADRENILQSIYVNTPSQKYSGSVKLREY